MRLDLFRTSITGAVEPASFAVKRRDYPVMVMTVIVPGCKVFFLTTVLTLQRTAEVPTPDTSHIDQFHIIPLPRVFIDVMTSISHPDESVNTPGIKSPRRKRAGITGNTDVCCYPTTA
jgi:hypothetical protein